MAIASLLRITDADLADARLLLRRGQARNAAVVGSRAVAALIRAVAASERGWPLAAGDDGVDAVPSINPVQPGVVATEAVLADAANQDVEPEGQLQAAPNAADVSDALDDVEAILDTVIQAFGVALSGAAAAENANPIRAPDEEAAEPAEDADEAAGADEAEDAAGADEAAELDEPEDEPVETGEATPSRDVPAAQDDGRSAPAEVVRARAPKRRAAASEERTEPGRGESRPPRPVIVFGEPPRQPRKRKRHTPPPIERAVTPPPADGARVAPGKPDAPVGPTGGQSAGGGAARQGPHDYTSTVFWALMDRWKLPDAEALALIGHTGGMTKKGTRPRFKVVGEEARLFGQLREIDAALSPLVRDTGAWMRQPIKDAPFGGQSAVGYITRHGVEGAKAVARLVLMTGLRRQTSA